MIIANLGYDEKMLGQEENCKVEAIGNDYNNGGERCFEECRKKAEQEKNECTFVGMKVGNGLSGNTLGYCLWKKSQECTYEEYVGKYDLYKLERIRKYT